MPEAYLVTQSRSGPRDKMHVGYGLILGRAVDCDYVLRDDSVSRRHMEIKEEDGVYLWKDLGSTNGVLINEERLRQGELIHGDLIRIAATTLRFEVSQDLSSESPKSTVFREVVLDRDGRVDTNPRTPVSTASKEAHHLLDAVYAVMNDIATEYDPCSLVDQILKTTMKAIDGQRGALFFAAPNSTRSDSLSTETLLPCPVCNRTHLIQDGKIIHTDTNTINISRTVVRRVLENGESVLIRDTESSGDIEKSESIQKMSLTSIICVPVRGKSGTTGILYIDTDRLDQHYTHQHMLLSTAVGNSAGLALENARLHRDVVEKERFEEEIRHAGKIQRDFLTTNWPDEDEAFSVYGETHPARVVGGDFYDFVRPRPHQVGLLIGDVSGKGMPAALAMARILAEFRVLVSLKLSPKRVMIELNKEFVQRTQQGMFCTLCYLTLDLNTGKVRCTNAGHFSVIKINQFETSEFGQSTGVPIGILLDEHWSETETTIEKGDTLLLYSDGIIEARGSTTHIGDESPSMPDQYGTPALIGLSRDMAGESPKVLVKEIMKDVERFCEPGVPHDDCTLLALRYTG